MKTVAIITEANNSVGTGHLYESLAVAKELIKNKHNVLFFVNQDAPTVLLNHIPCKYKIYGTLDHDVHTMVKVINNNGCHCILTNLRKIDNEQVKALKSYKDSCVICIDELGHRPLDCDIVINSLIDDYYHNYGKSCAIKYFGTKYFIMKPDFSKLRNKNSVTRKNIEVISISMGGSDISGTTLKLLCCLSKTNVKINVITGGGFLYHEELDRLLDQLSDQNITAFKNISNIAEIFLESDIAFCMGGNVLYELACLGIPALTVYEAPHEKSSSEKFQAQGFGYCVGQAERFTNQDVWSAMKKLEYDIRTVHKERGMSIVDGHGLNRILKIIEGYNG